MTYRSEIDGLRAFAVLSVVLFHADVPFFTGGYVGVDIFFVISGYLITSLILKDVSQNRFSIVNFYERRIRRILPALFLVVLASVVISWFVMVPYQLLDFSQSILATLSFISNILFWYESDYFAAEAELKPLLHTWSLAVEEQFYILFPLLLAALAGAKRHTLIAILLLIFLVSFVSVILFGPIYSAANFYLISFRAWELLAGALAAVWLYGRPLKGNSFLAATGLVVICASFVLVQADNNWPNWWSLFPVIGTVFVVVFAGENNGVARFLSMRIFVGLGLISYSLYLWHWPLLAFLKIATFGQPDVFQIALVVCLSFLLAYLSWRFVETPTRNRASIGIRTLLGGLFCVACLLVIFSVTGIKTSGFRSVMLSGLSDDAAKLVIDRDAEVGKRRPLWDAELESAKHPFENDDRHKVLILGDSLSADLYVSVSRSGELFPGYSFRRIRLDDGCIETFLAFKRSDDDDRAVEASDKCEKESLALLDSGHLDVADEVVLASNWQPETVADARLLASELASEKRQLAVQGVAAFNDVASLSLQVTNIEEPVREFMFKNLRTKFLVVNEELEAMTSAMENVRYLDKLALFCVPEENACDITDKDGRFFIFDNAHVTVAGSAAMATNIKRDKWFAQ